MTRKSTSKRPTSRDVAELAGVSQTTVSHVINGKQGGNIRISDETRRKVWEAVETLNYRPSTAARTLRTDRSNLLAIIVPHMRTPFQPLLATAIQEEAEKEDFEVIIYHTHDELQREKRTLDALLSRGVDGLITQTYTLSTEDLDRLVQAGIAVVIYGVSPTHPFVDNIMHDEARAAEEVVSYLIKQGHRRIATIAGPQTTWGGRLRKEGYINALRNHGLPIEDELIRETEFKRGNGAKEMQELLALPEPPTAVFAANDILAVYALLYAIDAGLSAVDSGFSVPDDVVIVGFDDIPEASIVRPRLTTVHKDIDLLGATAVRMLIERMNSEELLPSRQKTLDYEIIYRESA
jgi:DNA-binding LacI/PurR family transcriptional regulator